MVVRLMTAQRPADESVDQMDRVLHALADPTRRDIVRTVVRAEHSVSALAERFPMSFAAVQKHVAVLERAALVRKRRVGRTQMVRADLRALGAVHELCDQYETLWRHRIDRMERLLAEPDPATTHHRTEEERQR